MTAKENPPLASRRALNTTTGQEVDKADDSTGSWPTPSEPWKVAKLLYTVRQKDGYPTLVHWRGGWMEYTGTHWREIDTEALVSWVYKLLSEAHYRSQQQVRVRDANGKPVKGKDGKQAVNTEWVEVPWNPNRNKVTDVMHSLTHLAHLSSEFDPPCWLSTPKWCLGNGKNSVAAQMISCKNGLLELGPREIRPHTPALFNLVSVPFTYRHNSPKPTQWLAFLDSIWPGDEESKALLQEWFGYVLSGRTDMQKILLMVGPRRSGKGVIARILTALIGEGNVSGLLTDSLGTNFGLASLIGKPLAIIGDARLDSRSSHVMVERLLKISGEDLMDIDRKYRDAWTGKLPTRIMLLSNELPRLRDNSAAIASRLLILQTTKSFLGHEDLALEGRLRDELAGILAWSLEGLDRLTRFTVPKSSKDTTRLMADMVSPVRVFLREECVCHPEAYVRTDQLFIAWRTWCQINGYNAGSREGFGRDLHSAAAVPDLKRTKPRIDGRQVPCYTGLRLRAQYEDDDDRADGDDDDD